MWSVKREIRGCLTPAWKNRASVSRAVIFARSLRYQNTAWQVEKQRRKKAKVAQADTEEAQSHFRLCGTVKEYQRFIQLVSL